MRLECLLLNRMPVPCRRKHPGNNTNSRHRYRGAWIQELLLETLMLLSMGGLASDI